MSFYYARKKFPLQYTFLLYSMGRQGYRSGKGGRDLVQRRRKNKGRRGFVHQVKALGFGKRRGAWCKGDGRTRAGGDSCTKSKRPDLEKGGGTWCKGDGSTRAGGDSCTKSERVDLEKGGGIWCKGDGGTRAGGDSCTKSKRQDLEKGGRTWCKGDGRTRVGTDSCTKSPSVANERSQRNRSVPAIPFHILRIIPENAILVRNFVKIKGNDAK